MKILKTILGLAFLTFVLALAWRQVFPNDPAQIRKMLDGLATTLSRSGKSSAVSTMLALDRVRDCLDPNVQLTISAPGFGRVSFSDREEMVQGVAAAWTRAGGDIRVAFDDIVVTLAPDSQSATAKLTARGTQRGASDFFLQEFKLTLAKKDSKWRVTTITPFEVFK